MFYELSYIYIVAKIQIAGFESCVKDLMDSSESLMPSVSMAFSDLEKLLKSTKCLETFMDGGRIHSVKLFCFLSAN